MGGGGGSYSKTSRKAAPKSAPKVSKGPKKPTHSQLVAKWQEQGGKFVEEKKEWTKADIDRARRAKEAAEEAAAAAAAAGSAPPPPEEEEQSGPAGPTVAELARARMAELAIQMQTLSTEAAPTVDAETYAAATVDELRISPRNKRLDCPRARRPEGQGKLQVTVGRAGLRPVLR